MIRTAMRVRGVPLAIVLALLPLGACMATVGVNNVSIPKNAAKICAGHCKSIGMRLSAVAIMAENVGCVCQAAPAESDEEASNAGELSTPAAGMSTIAAQQAAAAVAAAQAQAVQRRHQSASHHY